MNSKQRFRIRVVGLGVLLAALVLISTVYSIAILHSKEYAKKADSQYSLPTSSLFDRGTIFFTSKDGTKTAAASVDSGHLLYMNPKLITDPVGTYEALSHYVSIDRASFIAKALKKNDPYEEILHRVSLENESAIKALGLPGIGLVPKSWRFYPGDTLAAHEVGLIGENNASSTVSGRYGLERYYDSVLSRENVSGAPLNIFAKLFSDISSVFDGNADRGDIVTTIEPRVESYLDKVLSEIEKSWKPDEVGGIIMDPVSGEIVAMSSRPTFNPNDLKGIKSANILSNSLVEHIYEMGSIMKPLTMAVALDSGAVNVDSTYDDIGCMTLDKKKICNYDQKARGIVPMQQILSQSLNIGAATIALKTGGATFSRYFFNFGLDKKSGIDLPNEAMPLTSALNKPTDINIATASYGQGIAISPVGMIRALSVIANGGYVVTPHLVKEIRYTDGRVKSVDPLKVGPVLKQETIDEVRRMLVEVVDTSLAKGAIKKEHYTVAAKTGTAAIADHVNGGYYSDRYLHSFFGFFPAYKPKFIVFLYHVYPKNVQYASETLVKPFDELTSFLLNYYSVSPDR